MEDNACLYSQWFVGVLNTVTDSLSRDLNLEADDLTSFLIFSLPEQVSQHFRISQLPSAVDSFLISLFQEIPETQQPWKTPNKIRKLLGASGSSIPNPSDLQTHSYRTYQLTKSTESFTTFSGGQRGKVLRIYMNRAPCRRYCALRRGRRWSDL
jgi:hypothetical protein